MIRAIAVSVAIATVATTATLAATASSASTEPSSSSPAYPSNAARAEASFDALQRMFGTSDGSGLYRELYPAAKTDRRYSYEWPFSQVHVAALDLIGVPGASYAHALAAADSAQLHYWDSKADGGHPGFEATAQSPYGNGGTLFYDDNEWVGLEAIQDYAQRQHPRALRQAQKIFDLTVSGWDNDTTHPRPGGVYWMQSRRNNDRNTVSNMPAAELGLRLYQITRQRSDFLWALKMYRWTNRNLQAPNGLYYDHVDLRGRVDRSIYSYNQGVPIAVNVLLYRLTKNASYLHKAKRIATAAYQYFVSGGRLKGQSVALNSIFFKHLLVLESIIGGAKYRAAMQSYADWMWDNQRDPDTGIFTFPSDRRTDVIEQAAASQIYATLAWPQGAVKNLA